MGLTASRCTLGRESAVECCKTTVLMPDTTKAIIVNPKTRCACRARRCRLDREHARGSEETEPRAAGSGALVLAAATRLRGTPEEHTGVIGAVYVPAGASMGTARERSEEMAFWSKEAKGHGEEGMGELLEWMDRARAIVVYESGWIHEGMGGAYGGDEGRREAHLRKVVDVGEHVRREHGRVVREGV